MEFNTTIAIDIWNVTETHGAPSQSVHEIVLEMLFISITWLVCIPANILVCVVIHRSRRVQSTTNYFVVSMAISDLVLAFFCTPFISVHIITDQWLFGTVICRFVRFFQTLGTTSLIMVVVAISVDRYYAIIYPLSFKITRGTAKHLISFCWIIAFVLSVPTLYFVEYSYLQETDKQHCSLYIPNTNWASTCYGAMLVSLTFVIPALLVVGSYSQTFCHVWTTGPRKQLFRRTMNPVSRTKVKMLKMLIVVTITIVVLLTPHFVIQLWHSFSSDPDVELKLFAISFTLVLSITVLKPFLYVLLNSNFRRGCREVFCMTNMKCYRRNNYVITNASTISKKNHVGVMPVESKERYPGSPTATFNRYMELDKTAWPLPANISSTYL